MREVKVKSILKKNRLARKKKSYWQKLKKKQKR